MSLTIPDLRHVALATEVIAEHLSPVPLIRSYPLEAELGLPPRRRVWLQDYGWTPVGSFKVLGALNWVANHLDDLRDRPIAAHSSGNFASGLACAGARYDKRVLIVMPDTAPRVKFERTRGFGAEVRTYDIARDPETGERDRLTCVLAEEEHALQASPYDDPHVIAGNGVGGVWIAEALRRQGRTLSHFLCQVSGGGLMAGHVLALADAFPRARRIGVEPEGADDFRRSLASGRIERNARPVSICDGLLSYDVGRHNWPILQRLVTAAVAVPDAQTRAAMAWLWTHHGLRTEPSGAIALAALLHGRVDPEGDGDLVVVISGRNADDDTFRNWIAEA